LTASGCSAEFTGSYEGDFWVTVNYGQPYDFKCKTLAKISVVGDDNDGDGHYPVGACAEPADDCNDNDPTIYPGAPEVCDNKDNDCDGEVDEELSTDADGDGHYPPDSCKTPNDDCDDSDPTIYPDAPEICDNKDNDCDGEIDEDLNTDADGDGHYTPDSCLTPNDDCNDTPGVGVLIYPGALEVCGDNLDNTCDGQVDEGCDIEMCQCDSDWRDLEYEGSEINNKICGEGCALTTLAMILKNYGANVDVKKLNSWMTENKGFNKNESVLWEVAEDYSGANFKFKGAINGQDNTTLDKYLANGNPVVLKVKNARGGGHFVLAAGKTGDTYTIIDPGSCTSTRTTLKDRYKNKFDGLRLFR